jgi:hypothetical protein
MSRKKGKRMNEEVKEVVIASDVVETDTDSKGETTKKEVKTLADLEVLLTPPPAA